nr:tetratricopeptide repeat protein [Sphingomonas sp. BGYR3]
MPALSRTRILFHQRNLIGRIALGQKWGCLVILMLVLALSIGGTPPKDAMTLAAACEAGLPDSCADLAQMYDKGEGVRQDRKRAAALYANACDRGLMAACYNAGSILFDMGEKKSAARIFAMFCDRNNKDACYQLGYMYQNGDGLSVNYPVARKLYAENCARKDAASCNNLGVMYQNGEDVAVSPTKAVAYYRLACDLKEPIACVNMGLSHLDAYGVEKNRAKARAYFVRACTMGHQPGCDNRDILDRPPVRYAASGYDTGGSGGGRNDYPDDFELRGGYSAPPPPPPPPVTPIGGWGGLYGCFGQVC